MSGAYRGRLAELRPAGQMSENPAGQRSASGAQPRLSQPPTLPLMPVQAAFLRAG
jgi:hypothetical protein